MIYEDSEFRDDDLTETMYCDTWKTLGFQTTPLKYRSTEKPPTEPQITKQKTKLSPAPTK